MLAFENEIDGIKFDAATTRLRYALLKVASPATYRAISRRRRLDSAKFMMHYFEGRPAGARVRGISEIIAGLSLCSGQLRDFTDGGIRGGSACG